MKPVTLDVFERSMIRHKATLKSVNIHSGRYHDRNCGPKNKSPWERDLEGFAGEYVVAKVLNVFSSFNCDIDRFDAIGRTGATIDVKTTDNLSGNLLVPLGKAKDPCDVYVLVVGKFPTYEVKGYARKEEVFKEENIQDFGYGLTYVVRREDLHEMRIQTGPLKLNA